MPGKAGVSDDAEFTVSPSGAVPYDRTSATSFSPTVVRGSARAATAGCPR